MIHTQKACPVLSRQGPAALEFLAFIHPEAGKQFVKGTIEEDENPLAAAERELHEESGIVATSTLQFIGSTQIGCCYQYWHFFHYPTFDLPDIWEHKTADDHGHTFKFFWHPAKKALSADWHAVFHEAFDYFAPRVACI